MQTNKKSANHGSSGSGSHALNAGQNLNHLASVGDGRLDSSAGYRADSAMHCHDVGCNMGF